MSSSTYRFYQFKILHEFQYSERIGRSRNNLLRWRLCIKLLPRSTNIVSKRKYVLKGAGMHSCTLVRNSLHSLSKNGQGMKMHAYAAAVGRLTDNIGVSKSIRQSQYPRQYLSSRNSCNLDSEPVIRHIRGLSDIWRNTVSHVCPIHPPSILPHNYLLYLVVVYRAFYYVYCIVRKYIKLLSSHIHAKEDLSYIADQFRRAFRAHRDGY